MCSPVWSLNGVNVFSANLVRGLRDEGVDAQLLITLPEMHDPKPMPWPTDIPVETLPVRKGAGWPARWRAMKGYLEERAPCVYLPNYDFWHSCISPRLSRGVGIVGIVHSDDPQHYEHVARLGRYWNAIVAVSPEIAERTAALDRSFAPRVRTIRYGVEVPPALPPGERHPGTPLRIVYHGVLRQAQKRILDLAAVVGALQERGVPAKLTVVGGGPEEGRLRAAAAALPNPSAIQFLGIVPHWEVGSLLAKQDAFVLTSRFEGLPHALLEAMAQGCVPVVSDVRSGVPGLIRDGYNGFRVPVGQVGAFAERLAVLHRNRPLGREMARNAHRTIVEGGLRIGDMVRNYASLFDQVLREAASGAYRRPRGIMRLPPVLSWKDLMPTPLRSAGRWLLRRNLEQR